MEMDFDAILKLVVPAVAPSAAIIIALATFLLSQRRADRTDARAAAKDTVEILAVQNKTLLLEVADLRERILLMEQDRRSLTTELKASETQRRKLHAEVMKLTAMLHQSTKDIRDDVQANTAMTERAAERADAAYVAANATNEKIANIGGSADARLTRLEDAAHQQTDERDSLT